MNPERFIETIRNSFNGSVDVYTKGSCYQFYLILKEVFPQAIAWDDQNHIITEINGKYYDITGEVERTNHLPFDYEWNLGKGLIETTFDIYEFAKQKRSNQVTN